MMSSSLRSMALISVVALAATSSVNAQVQSGRVQGLCKMWSNADLKPRNHNESLGFPMRMGQCCEGIMGCNDENDPNDDCTANAAIYDGTEGKCYYVRLTDNALDRAAEKGDFIVTVEDRYIIWQGEEPEAALAADTSLSTGAIAGIVLGSIAVGLLAVIAIIVYLRRPQRHYERTDAKGVGRREPLSKPALEVDNVSGHAIALE